MFPLVPPVVLVVLPINEKHTLTVAAHYSLTLFILLYLFPTAVLKQCLEELVPTLTFLINESFQTGYFPEGLKHSNISPLIKDSKLDKDDL